MPSARENPWHRLWPVLLLTGLLCLRAQLADTSAVWNPSPLLQACGFALAAGLWAAWPRRGDRDRRLLSHAIAGAAILLASRTCVLLGISELDGSAVLIAMTLAPGVLAVAGSSIDPDESRSLSDRLWPALAASAGVLLLVVQPSLADWRVDLALILMPLLTGLGAAFFYMPCSPAEGEPMQPLRRNGTAAKASAVAAAVLALTWLFFVRGTQPAWGGLGVGGGLLAVAMQAACAMLTLFSLDRAGPERWSAQFTLLPLILLAEGPLLLHIDAGPRGWLGLGLLCLASWRLLFPPETVH